MAIIQIPDDAAISNLVARRSALRDVGPIGGKWVDEPIIGQITERSTKGRKITLMNGVASLANIRKLTIIGHGARHGVLIGPYATMGTQRLDGRSELDYSAATAPIRDHELCKMLTQAGYVGGYSIDVMGCYTDEFARDLSKLLPGIYVKGYSDTILIESESVLPMDVVGEPKLGKAYSRDEKGGPNREKQVKNRYLNGELVVRSQYKAPPALPPLPSAEKIARFTPPALPPNPSPQKIAKYSGTRA